jgi:hypothetical protein
VPSPVIFTHVSKGSIDSSLRAIKDGRKRHKDVEMLRKERREKKKRRERLT